MQGSSPSIEHFQLPSLGEALTYFLSWKTCCATGDDVDVVISRHLDPSRYVLLAESVGLMRCSRSLLAQTVGERREEIPCELNGIGYSLSLGRGRKPLARDVTTRGSLTPRYYGSRLPGSDCVSWQLAQRERCRAYPQRGLLPRISALTSP
jgi:hypothetical protein